MEGASGSLKEACQDYLDTLTNSAASRKATDALVPELEKAAANGCELSKEILKDKDLPGQEIRLDLRRRRLGL